MDPTDHRLINLARFPELHRDFDVQRMPRSHPPKLIDLVGQILNPCVSSSAVATLAP